MKDVDPWLNPNPRLASGREFKDQYETNWASQFEKEPETFVAVPNELVDHAKRILAPLEQDMQLPLELALRYCPLYMFSRFYKEKPMYLHKRLAEQRIPSVFIQLDRVKSGNPFDRAAKAKCDCHYWVEGHDYLLHQVIYTNPVHDVREAIKDIDRYLAQIDWVTATRYAYVIKTKALLKGNSDGLPKTYEQSQNWRAHK